MIPLDKINQDISFNEENHIYKNKDGQILTSVTQMLHLYHEPFDPYGFIVKACAKKQNLTVDELKKKWKEINDEANIKGKSLHNQIEYYIQNNKILECGDYKDVVEKFAKIPFEGKLYSEVGLNSRFYKLAGTSDIIEIIGNKKAKIHDLKTNKRFDTKPRYGNRFLYPLNKLGSCHHTAYSLQILIYGEMIKEYGYDFEPGKILYINPQTRNIDEYPVLDLTKEVKKLLYHYKKMSEW